MSVPFLSAAASRSDRGSTVARASGAGARSSGGTQVVIGRQCRARAPGWHARRPGAPGRRSGGRRPAGPAGRSTRCRGAGSTPARTCHPSPGGSACASPARSTTTIVARSRVSSRRRHVPMLATASAPRMRNSSRSGRGQRLERVGGDRRARRARPRSRRLDPVDPVDRGRPPARGGRRAEATTRPRFCHGSPATTSSTRSRSSARGSRPPRRGARCAPGSNVPPSTPSARLHTGSVRARPCLHSG